MADQELTELMQRIFREGFRHLPPMVGKHMQDKFELQEHIKETQLRADLLEPSEADIVQTYLDGLNEFLACEDREEANNHVDKLNNIYRLWHDNVCDAHDHDHDMHQLGGQYL